MTINIFVHVEMIKAKKKNKNRQEVVRFHIDPLVDRTRNPETNEILPLGLTYRRSIYPSM
jgi:hypothetical protein